MLISNRATNALLLLILAVGIGIVAMLASGARGGPLDPAGPPALTMHTLDDTPPSWDRKLDSTNGSIGVGSPMGCNSDRFECVFPRSIPLTTDYDGVLDRETGLVWQRVPSTNAADWLFAAESCHRDSTAGRAGWRLPTAPELGSLVTRFVGLPAGHPFVASGYYWTSTEYDATQAYDGLISTEPALIAQKTSSVGYWCVRGATGDR